MNKLNNKIIILVLSLVLIFNLVGCGNNTNSEENKTNKSVAEQGKYPYTITDQAGREIIIEKKYERVAMTSVRPIPAAYLAATGSINELVGINPSSMVAAKSSMLAVLAPNIVNLETGYVDGNETNVEELLKLKPEVAFCLNTNTDEIAALEAVGIKAVGMETNGTDAIELFSQWAKLIGDVMGKENQAAAIIDHSRAVAQKVKDVAATIPENEKKTVMFLYLDDGNTIKVAGSDLYSQYWCETIGAVNAAADVSNVAIVNMEQIYKWNPDYIFITNFTETQPEDLYNNKYPGQDWSSLTAVKEGRVFKNPLGVYRWFTPTSDGALMLQWIAQKVYPEYYDYYNIEEEIINHYSKFYGYDLNDKELELILNPSSDAGAYKARAN
jgi:iron complex transport system substrate-binding protein